MGQQDLPLNDVGRQQAREVSLLFKDIQFSTICYSPLQRAAQTAKIIAEQLPAKLVAIDELKERYYASFEGMLKADIKNIRMEKGVADYVPPNAESASDCKERMFVAVNRALEQPGPVLIVSHGGMFKSLIEIIDDNYSNLINNCAAVKISQHDGKFDLTWL